MTVNAPELVPAPAVDRRGPRVALVAFGVVVLIVAALTTEIYDDPWILYRYAENLAAGDGWTFNPGHVTDNAVTSALTVLLLAAGLTLHVPVTVTSTVLFVVGSWAAASFSYLVFRGAGREHAGFAAGLLILLAPPLISLRGMETALYLGLLAAGLYLMDRRQAAAGIVLGFAVLARPDALLVALSVAGWLGWRHRALPWQLAAGGAAVLVPWFVVSEWLTGGVLPSTLAAKAAQADSGAWQPYLMSFVWVPLGDGQWPWFLLALPLGGVGAVVALRSRPTPLVPLAAGALAIVLAYGVVLNIAAYAWYVALPVFVLCWLAGMGVEAVLAPVCRDRARMAVVAGLAGWLVLSAALTPVMTPLRRQYEPIAAWLAANTPPGATVASAEIGRVGYLSDRTSVDYLGLLDRRAVPHIAAADWTWWVTELRPDYWVAMRNPKAAFDAAVRRSPEFAAAYRPVMETADAVVYRRR